LGVEEIDVTEWKSAKFGSHWFCLGSLVWITILVDDDDVGFAS